MTTASRSTAGYRRPLTAQEAVLEELRRAIMARELKPGERIRQDAVAERLGVSRVPVREALKVLETEGQVAYEPHRGYKVTELDVTELEELYLMRRLLESEAIRHAVPKVDDPLLERLEDLMTQMAEADRANDLTAFIDLNRNFHLLLYERAGMPRLFQTIQVLWQNSDSYRSVFLNDPVARRRVQAEHRPLVEACRAGDVEAAIAVMDTHRNHAVNFLSSMLQDEDRRVQPTQTEH